MDCRDCQDWLQHKLDGGPHFISWLSIRTELTEHLADCPVCRRLQSATQLLQTGLRLSTPQTPPPDLSQRIVSRVLRDRRQSQRRRRVFAGVCALAASVLLVFLADRSHPVPAKPSASQDVALLQPKRPPSIRETVSEASTAVAGLTSRTVDQAVDQTRRLLPVLDESMLPPMDPAPVSLPDAGQGVRAGLGPIGDSARRAIALFRRDLTPGMTPHDRKPGL